MDGKPNPYRDHDPDQFCRQSSATDMYSKRLVDSKEQFALFYNENPHENFYSTKIKKPKYMLIVLLPSSDDLYGVKFYARNKYPNFDLNEIEDVKFLSEYLINKSESFFFELRRKSIITMIEKYGGTEMFKSVMFGI